MALIFTLSDFGHAFATRERGAELREELMGRVTEHDAVLVDFAGVTNVSYSFADEFLAKLRADAGIAVEVRNASPRVSRIADRAVARRTDGAITC